MNDYNEKYMVSLSEEGNWDGWRFDTLEEAVKEARRVITEKNGDSYIFGDFLDNYLSVRDDVETKYPRSFFVWRIQRPSVSSGLGVELIEWLNEPYLFNEINESYVPMKYVFKEGDREELNEILESWFTRKIIESNYYELKLLGEVLVKEE